MKNQVITIGVAILFAFGSTAIVGCGGSEHNKTSEQHEDVYACSMHPEITGKKGDDCSKCGMKLEIVDEY